VTPLTLRQVFQVADHMGRKNELIVGALLYLIGAFIAALSARPTWDAGTGISVLILGRVIYGCGIGFAMHGPRPSPFLPLSLSVSLTLPIPHSSPQLSQVHLLILER
jgi:MFS family permease